MKAFWDGWRLRLTARLCVMFSIGFVISIHGATVSLIWDANTEPDVIGYKFYYGVQSRTYTNVTDVGNLITNTVFGLEEGVTYFFAVTAYNTEGLESDFSNEVSYTPVAPTNQVNQPPTLDPISDVTLAENAGPQTISLTGISSGATNEAQPLTLTAISDNPILIPNPVVTYISPGATGLLIFTPVINAIGTARITVTVDDGSATNNSTSRSFIVTVNPVNEPPTLGPISDQFIQRNQSTGAIPLAITDPDTPAPDLILTGTASSTNLVPQSQIVFNNIGSSWTLTVTPARGKIGTTFITVRVSDGQFQASTIFLLTVLGNSSSTLLGLPLAEAPRITAITSEPIAGATVEWSSTPGAVYVLLSKAALDEPVWRDLSGVILAEEPSTSWIDGTAQGKPARFYRVVAP